MLVEAAALTDLAVDLNVSGRVRSMADEGASLGTYPFTQVFSALALLHLATKPDTCYTVL